MATLPLALLNTTIATTDGCYTIQTISLETAKSLVEDYLTTYGSELDSAVGHQSTADIMTTLLGVEVPMNRQMFEQQLGQEALVFKLNGRPPEGAVLTAEEIEEIGYTFKLMTRTA